MKIFEGQNILKLVKELPNDATFKAYLSKLKWGKTKDCLKAKFSYHCYNCGCVEGTTTNPLFHEVKFGLLNAFMIVFEMTTYSSMSFSSIQMGIRYGIRQPKAWGFMNKIRESLKSNEQYPMR